MAQYLEPIQLRGPDGPEELTIDSDAPQDPVPVGLVALTVYKPGAKWSPRRLSTAQGVLAMMEHAAPARDRPAKTLSTLRLALANAGILSGERGEADEVAHLLLDAVSVHERSQSAEERLRGHLRGVGHPLPLAERGPISVQRQADQILDRVLPDRRPVRDYSTGRDGDRGWHTPHSVRPGDLPDRVDQHAGQPVFLASQLCLAGIARDERPLSASAQPWWPATGQAATTHRSRKSSRRFRTRGPTALPRRGATRGSAVHRLCRSC